MSTRPISFAPGEWFHCYNRGVDKRHIFMDEYEAERFLILLYACNGIKKVHPSDYSLRQGKALTILEVDRGDALVDIAAYCLMPNHTHLVLREIDYGGISAFMQKLGTAYTMFFNKKHGRTGPLFAGKFKAKHIASDAYFRRIFNYLHANPAELFEPKWKEGVVRKPAALKESLRTYRYSSFPDYLGAKRSENIIVNMKAALEQLDTMPSYQSIIDDARAFYNYEISTGEELD